VQTPQNNILLLANGVPEKNNKNGIYDPGIIAHSNIIINHNTNQSHIPETE
jgi:hypothetical protein